VKALALAQSTRRTTVQASGVGKAVKVGLMVALALKVGLALKLGLALGVWVMVAVGVAVQLGVKLGVRLGVQACKPTTSMPWMVALLFDEVMLMRIWPFTGLTLLTVTS